MAQVAKLTQLILVKTVPALKAQMLLPFVLVLRADPMHTVIILLAVLAHAAVFALQIHRTQAAGGAQVIIIVCRFDTKPVDALGLVAVGKAAFLAQTALLAER